MEFNGRRRNRIFGVSVVKTTPPFIRLSEVPDDSRSVGTYRGPGGYPRTIGHRHLAHKMIITKLVLRGEDWGRILGNGFKGERVAT